MNIIALIAAAIMITAMFYGIKFSNTFSKLWQRLLSKIAAIILPFIIIPTGLMLIQQPVYTAQLSGKYFFILGIMFLAVRLIFFRQKKTAPEAEAA